MRCKSSRRSLILQQAERGQGNADLVDLGTWMGNAEEAEEQSRASYAGGAMSAKRSLAGDLHGWFLISRTRHFWHIAVAAIKEVRREDR